MSRYIVCLSTLLLLITSGYSQQFGIEIYGGHDSAECTRFSKAFFNRPKETQFSIKQDGPSLYFEFNDKKWFDQLFIGAKDGIAIDLVPRDRYNCDVDEIENSQIRGAVLKPMYKEALKKGVKSAGENQYRVFLNKVPPAFAKQELEFNILFLGNNKLCQYFTIYDLESYQWELLDMGMYLDSLTYNTKNIQSKSTDKYLLRTKTMLFEIPFEKNKSDYSPEDIRPLYDSLRLTDYTIKTIDIKAYSSVEGSLARNLELQDERAKSIAAAMQTFQTPTINTSVSSSENWVEFFNDIDGTEYQNLRKLSKSEIKTQLESGLSTTLEPILKNHRKALVELKLERKDKYQTMSPDQLIEKFNTSVLEENVDEALLIQNSLFDKLNDKVISPDFLNRMEVPEQIKFVKIFNKNSAIRFMNDVRQSMIVYNELKKLEKMAPKNKEIKYNLAVVKFPLWRYKAMDIDPKEFKSEINGLGALGIDQSLITRMMVNYHIVMAETYMREGNYDLKDKSVEFIHDNYQQFTLSDFDYLSLAQFFSYYANTNYSIELLEDKARTIDINEDLLFYYLNLTIIDPELVATSDYRTVMLNAYNLNPKRYCGLFGTYGKGGVTFQLLENGYLRRTYCENCNN